MKTFSLSFYFITHKRTKKSMETSHYFRRHGFIFIVLLLVMILFSVSSFASEISGSYDARGIKTHNDRKRNLSGSKPGGSPPPGKEYPLASCDKGYVFSEIKFADYGQPSGSSCETLKRGNCGAPATMRLVKKIVLEKIGVAYILQTRCLGRPIAKDLASICC
ncbi:unnamed protein product [Thlaspi arvense]|uniref:Uncharacterized protein n=1 Tax=Thlaspi arvense TaxID=13288 RepID=A0AAU9SIM4_THLAR|nr:unnamed protein product [Thlaspi arvense]